MTEVADKIFEITDAPKPGGLIERLKAATGQIGEFPDIDKLAERGSLEPSDVANLLRVVVVELKEDARVLKKAIKSKKEVDPSYYRLKDEKDYGLALAKRRKEIADTRYTLRVLNAVRMPGPVFVYDYDREEAVGHILDLVREGDGRKYKNITQKLSTYPEEFAPTPTKLMVALHDIMKVKGTLPAPQKITQLTPGVE